MAEVRLIDANALKKALMKPFNWNNSPEEIQEQADFNYFEVMIDAASTIDAVPVVHGRVVWKNRFMGGFVPDVTITDKAGKKHTGTLDTTHYEPVPYCSECGKELGVSSLAYCPNCGAKMDGGAEG